MADIAQSDSYSNNTSAKNIHLAEMPVAVIGYYIAFALYSIGALIQLTTFTSVLGISREAFVSGLDAVVVILLIVKFITQRTSFIGWCAAVAIILIGFESWRHGNEGWFFWLALFVVCSDGIRLKPLAAITLCIVAALTAATLLCCSLGMIQNRLFTRAGVVRPAYGFKHPNYFGSCLLLICACVSTLRFGRNPIPDIILIVFTMILNITYVDSRSSAFLSLFQIIFLLCFYCVRSVRKRRVLSIVFLVGVGAVIFISLYLMANYDSSNVVHRGLNSLLSGRFNLAHSYYSMQPLTLFGDDFSGFAPIYWELGEPATFLVDNAFCHLVLRYGVVSAALFFAGYFGTLIHIIHNGEWDALLFGLVLMTIYGLGETLGIRIECNFFLVAMGPQLLFQNSSLLKKDGSVGKAGEINP